MEILNKVLRISLKQNSMKILLLSLLCVYPVVPSYFGMDYLIHIAIIANIFAIVAMAWDINGGFTGQMNLAPAFSFGVGGYTSAILSTRVGLHPVATVIIGILTAFMAAIILGLPALRTKGPYLAVVTFSVSEVARLLAIYFSGITGGDEGIGRIPKLFQNTTVNYYWTLLMLMVFLIVSLQIVNSKLGLAFRAVSEDEVRAETLGINVTKYKLISFCVCSVIAATAGSIYVYYQSHIEPQVFALSTSVGIITMTAVGGEKTLVGAVIGAYIVGFSTEALRFVTGPFPWVRLAIYGFLLTIVMLFAPRGILGLKRGKST